MGDKSPIQWTEATWNPTTGCTRVSAGCDHCYAFQLHDQRHIAWKRGRFPDAPQQYHKPFSQMQLMPDRLDLPLHWRKPRRIFVNSMSDLFHPDVPGEFINRVWNTMRNAKQHTYQILTKRPERLLEWTQHKARATGWPINEIWPDWIWLGVSVENQAAADERIPLLLQTPAHVRFLSCEPLLGPVNLRHLLFHPCADGCGCRWPDDPDANECACGGECQYADDWGANPGIDWIIIGGESGKHARFVDLVDVEDLVDQCHWAGIAPFVKQLGTVWAKTNKAKDHHGGDMSEWPEHLRVREYPQVQSQQRAEGDE